MEGYAGSYLVLISKVYVCWCTPCIYITAVDVEMSRATRGVNIQTTAVITFNMIKEGYIYTSMKNVNMTRVRREVYIHFLAG